jgi:hypothetical protein
VHFNPDPEAGFEGTTEDITNILEKDIEQFRIKGT